MEQKVSVFVGGIPYSVSKSEFEDFATGVDPAARSARLMMETMDRNKGFGFLQYPDEPSARRAIDAAESSASRWILHGARLSLRLSTSRTVAATSGAGGSAPPQGQPQRHVFPERQQRYSEGERYSDRGRYSGTHPERSHTFPTRSSQMAALDERRAQTGTGAAVRNDVVVGPIADELKEYHPPPRTVVGPGPTGNITLPLSLAWAEVSDVMALPLRPGMDAVQQVAALKAVHRSVIRHTAAMTVPNDSSIAAGDTAGDKVTVFVVLHKRQQGNASSFDRVVETLRGQGFGPVQGPPALRKRSREATHNGLSRLGGSVEDPQECALSGSMCADAVAEVRGGGDSYAMLKDGAGDVLLLRLPWGRGGPGIVPVGTTRYVVQ